MSKNLIIVFVALIIIIPVAFVVLKFISTPQLQPEPSLTDTTQKTNTIQKVVSNTPTTTTTNQKTTTYNPADDIRYVLANVTKANKTEKESKDFATALANSAVATENLDVSKCSPNPAILRIEFNKKLSVKNSDSVAHTLVINNRTFQVPAGGTTSIAATDIGEDGRIYPYSCDQGSSMVGVIWTSK